MATQQELEQQVIELEAALNQAAVFKTMADYSLEAIVLADLQAQLTYANRAAHALFKCDYDRQEMVGQPGANFWPEEDLPILAETVMPQALAGGWRGEVRQKRKDGVIFDASTMIFPLGNPQGEPTGLVVTIRDISERKKAEKNLREITEFQQAILDSASYAIISTTPAGIIQTFNPAAERMLGYSAQEVVGKESAAIFHDMSEVVARAGIFSEELGISIAPGFEVFVARSRQNLPNEYEWTYIRKDGSRCPILLSVTALRDAEGNITGFLGIASDITERKQTEEIISESEQRLADIINFLPDATLVIDREGRAVAWNRAIEEMTGVKAEEMLGQGNYEYALPFYRERRPILVDLVFLPDDEEFGQRYAHIQRQGAVLSAEAYAPYLKGEARYLYATAAALRDSKGNITGAIEVIRDITERKQAEVERAYLQQEIIEAQQHALKELSTPIIPVMDGIIVMPLVGSIDTMRAGEITRTLLSGISHYRAKIVIIDITGVPLVDSGVANSLNKTIEAARLKGARTIITGMSEAVAEAVVDIGINWSNVTTLSDLQSGLVMALNSVGIKLTH